VICEELVRDWRRCRGYVGPRSPSNLCWDGGNGGGRAVFWRCWAARPRWVERATDPWITVEQGWELLPIRFIPWNDIPRVVCEMTVIAEHWPLLLMECSEMAIIHDELRGIVAKQLWVYQTRQKADLRDEYRKLAARLAERQPARRAPVQLVLNLTTEAAE
jgi:hypothetical protein